VDNPLAGEISAATCVWPTLSGCSWLAIFGHFDALQTENYFCGEFLLTPQNMAIYHASTHENP
jgi:hypothetical protein